MHVEVFDENREILSTLFEISFDVTLFHFFFFGSFVLVMARSYWSSFVFRFITVVRVQLQPVLELR